MAWSLYRWVWRLESPLHIGMAPAGNLNRTRLYVPARNLWGTLTEALAQSMASVSTFPDYQRVGDQLKEGIRFSYLFPAEQEGNEWKAWLPHYKTGAELVWRREDQTADVADRTFRTRLLSTRPGTAIAPDSDTAQEATLREFEVIGPYWRSNQSVVGLVGYVFVQSSSGSTGTCCQLLGSPPPELLLIGGDTKYGLGRILRINCQNANDIFGCKVDLNQNDPVVKSDHILAHALPPASSNNFKGQYEVIAGWDYSKQLQSSRDLLCQPGSKTDQQQDWKILNTGYWQTR